MKKRLITIKVKEIYYKIKNKMKPELKFMVKETTKKLITKL